MESFNQFLTGIDGFLATAVGYVWGLPLVFTLCGAGILFTVALGGIQIKGFAHAIEVIRGKLHDPKDPGEITHFEALCTALSATVGLGNIAGVAIAISIGGPGAVFWMVVVGFLGMATKFAECSLSLMYRKIGKDGTVYGGPMYYIERGLGPGWKPLAIFFAVACFISSYGLGNMFQTNQVASILDNSFAIPKWITGLVISILVGIVIIGGIKRIARVTSKLVPFMGIFYIFGALAVIIANIDLLPGLIATIFNDAFAGTAATGGFAGVVFKEAMKQGVKRACFSNEAGLGSAPIAHSAASTKEPIREGVVALLEPFIDTVVICTMTALVILISGAWTEAGDLNGALLTAKAFDHSLPGFGSYFVPFAVFLFAYSTILSWSYYGEKATHYLWGEKGIVPYKISVCVFAFVGSIWGLTPVFNFSDIMNGLMVIPNLLAVVLLFPKLKKETTKYFKRLNAGEFH